MKNRFYCITTDIKDFVGPFQSKEDADDYGKKVFGENKSFVLESHQPEVVKGFIGNLFVFGHEQLLGPFPSNWTANSFAKDHKGIVVEAYQPSEITTRYFARYFTRQELDKLTNVIKLASQLCNCDAAELNNLLKKVQGQ